LASTSRSPATSMNGTFWLVWLTIFLAIRSSLASHLGADAVHLQLRGKAVQVRDVIVGDRNADHLHGRQPRRERARVMLGEDAEETARSTRTARGGSSPVAADAVGGGVTPTRSAQGS